MLRWHRYLLVWSLTCPLAGCGAEDVSGALGVSASEQQAERWSGNERPSIFSKNFEYRLRHLPLTGKVAQMPWPGSHWPVWEDGVNARWDGPNSLSAIEKFERATGASRLEDKVSRYYGLDAFGGEKSCTRDSQCPRHKSKCGIRRGARRGVCVGEWWGMCHNWSPAAIAESEPLHSVIYNGVEFKVNDIKALLTLVYTSAQCTQMAERSEKWRFPTDRAGRPVDQVIRQINPGAFHVALTNVVGLQEVSMVVDHDISYRVFNHPVASYKVKSLQQIDVATAHRMLDVHGWGYKYASHVDSLYSVQLELTLVMDTQRNEDGALVPSIDKYLKTWSYDYILELDASNAITGGEWVGKSKLHHPDFIWRARAHAGSHRAGGAVSVATILEIAELSRR